MDAKLDVCSVSLSISRAKLRLGPLPSLILILTSWFSVNMHQKENIDHHNSFEKKQLNTYGLEGFG